MSVIDTPAAGPPTLGFDARADIADSHDFGCIAARGKTTFSVRQGGANLWIVAAIDGEEVAALRIGHGGVRIDGPITRSGSADAEVFEFATELGALRAKIAFPAEDHAIVRCTTTLLPARDLALPFWPRDLYVLNASDGTIHTSQRGLRSGIVFAAARGATPRTLFYFQNFSSLTDYFAATKRTPADSVGGRWPELGYAPPSGEDCVLPGAREVVVSDAFLTVTGELPQTNGEIAAQYLDLLAQTYLCLPRPPVAFHDWPDRAARTLRDLNLSPSCTYVRRGTRYAMPYVGDDTKPPESMVQLTLAVNAGEYAGWSGESSALSDALAATVPDFFDENVGSLVRWLPGEDFDASQADENMNHDDMDSWYLYHALFNTSRLAADGNADAREIFRRSLPFAVRVARRFNYRWPIFFHLHTLDVVRAESAPGKGGERDVAGLYALVMLHAHELFGEDEYLAEAERAVSSLHELGFSLGYQMNTTGFAAEAALRLWKKTGRRTYLETSEICMANLWDNMWLWQCDYGAARNYRTFCGLFPLHDAPYLAAYEELEAQAKFHDYLDLGGEDVRPSLRLLLAEYQRYSLDRAAYYYPDVLPVDVVAEKARNGKVERALSIPLEDLQDGWERCGQVGQEVYGAGLALIYATRHYLPIAGTGCFAFCDYPVYDFQVDAKRKRVSLRVGGDPRGSCELRIIPRAADTEPLAFAVTTRAGSVVVPIHGKQTVEGHAAFPLRGGHTVEISWGASGIEIGDIRRPKSGEA
jgi:hypothetical protein